MSYSNYFSMNNTPRTDAEICRIENSEGIDGLRRKISTSFARELERENALLREENKFLNDTIDAFEWQRINAMSHEEVRKELLANWYTQERIDAGFAKLMASINAAKSLISSNATPPKTL